jgi:hypothetical protein
VKTLGIALGEVLGIMVIFILGMLLGLGVVFVVGESVGR